MDKHNLLHPPIVVKNFKDNDTILLINGTKNGKFGVLFLDAHFKELPKSMNVPVNDLSKFLNSGLCQNLKAVFFLLNDLDNIPHPVNLEIRQMVYEEVRKRKWHIHLVHNKTFSIMSSLCAANLDSKSGDVILNLVSMGQMVTICELQRKQEGYSYIGDRRINRFNRSTNDVATEILGTCNPEYVTVCDPQKIGFLRTLKSRFVPSKKVINIDLEDITESAPRVLKTISDHGYNQLIPFSMDLLAVANKSNFTDPEQAVIMVEGYNDLPLERIKVVPKSKKLYCVVILDTISGSYKSAGETQLSKEQGGHHRIKLALVVDRNSLPFLYQEPFIIPEVQELPQKLTARPDLNVPVIGFFDNSSVICIRDENGYTFLNEWNGLYGKDLYLSFAQEEPTIITDLNKVNDKDSFVVSDLIKILSMPPNDLKTDPNWGFKVISNDPQHPVLLQFETFLGSRKSSTPIFLMALLLKHHIIAIKKKSGKKPKEIGFCLFNDFSNEEKNRIQTGLEEACKLLKIGFIVVTNV